MSDAIVIRPFDAALKPHFARLNVAWLEKYFRVEPIDELVLYEPEAHVLDHGGDILFACRGDQVLGTCALKHHGDGNYELTKMAVDETAQGEGVGRLLLEATISLFKDLNGSRLYLESHHKLKPALKLYETGGFEHAERPDVGGVYERADIYMVYTG